MDVALVDAYVRQFLGYGNSAAKYWFVGMEHGGGATRAEVEARLLAWDIRGRREFEELGEYHLAFDYPAFSKPGMQWFGPKAKLQPTWAPLIRIVLRAEGLSCETEDVRRYQATAWGRRDGITALPEILSLPSQKLLAWDHASLADLTYLRDRRACLDVTGAARIERMRALIATYRPRAVICYGSGYLDWWTKLVGSLLDATALAGVRRGFRDGTSFYAIPHPVAHGRTTAYWLSIGELITRGPTQSTPADSAT
jgi:hypothetical protein